MTRDVNDEIRQKEIEEQRFFALFVWYEVDSSFERKAFKMATRFQK